MLSQSGGDERSRAGERASGARTAPAEGTGRAGETTAHPTDSVAEFY